MPYYATNYNYTPRMCPGRNLSQGKSHYVQQSHTHNRLLFNTEPESSPQASKSQASSRRISYKISNSLFSLVSKFEALDAVSLPIKIPSLQPATLQLARNSANQRGGTTASQNKQLETIFSPRSKSRSDYEEALAENEFTATLDDVFSSATYNVPASIKKSGSGRLRQIQYPYNVSNIRLRGEIQGHNFPSLQRTDFGSRIRGRKDAKVSTTDREREKKTVRERIKFYDGSMDLTAHSPRRHYSILTHEVPLTAISIASNPATGPSSHDPTLLNIPQIRRGINVRNNANNQPSLTWATGGSEHKSASTISGTPFTPTKSGPSHVSKKRNLVFGQDVPNPFFAQRDKSSTKTISPQFSPKTKRSPKLMIKKLDNSPLHSRRFLHNEGAVREVLDPAEADPSVKWSRGRKRAASNAGGNCMGLERRYASEKIEALYHTKSQERTLDTSREASRMREMVQLTNATVNGDIFEPSVDRKIESPTELRKESNVRNMKLLFDRDVSAKMFKACSLSPPRVSDKKIPALRSREEKPKVLQNLPLPMTQSSLLKSTVSSSKPVREYWRAKVAGIPAHGTHVQISSPTPACARSQQAKGKSIGDKIRIFEGKTNPKYGVSNEPKECFVSKNVSSSTIRMRKGLFENPCISTKCEKELQQEKGLKASDVRSIVDEFQDMRAEGKTGRWNAEISPSLTSARGLIAQRDGKDDPYSDTEQEMVVKEARCSLREPKPLRLVEMKRMMLLCREKVGIGAAVYKERSSLQSPMRV